MAFIVAHDRNREPRVHQGKRNSLVRPEEGPTQDPATLAHEGISRRGMAKHEWRMSNNEYRIAKCRMGAHFDIRYSTFAIRH